MKVMFMGTPDFAVGTLEALLAAGHEVELVVTQPDRPKGRSGRLCAPPVKECALRHGLSVYQPTRVREEENMEYLCTFHPDIIVVAAFGQLLPQRLLDLPRYCCMNIHASLLPKYRGASPIQWAVLNGDPVSGVTAMRMDAGLDTGDIMAQTEVILAPDETAGSLFDRLAEAGAQLAVDTMSRLEAGTVSYAPQDAELATHTAMIHKELGLINWARPAAEIERLIRGLNPWPSAYTYYNGRNFKIWKARVTEADSDAQPGMVICADKNGFVVQTGSGALELLEVQLEGRKRMDAGAFLRGNTVETGVFLVSDD